MNTFLRSVRRIRRAQKILTALQWLAVLRLLLTVAEAFWPKQKG